MQKLYRDHGITNIAMLRTLASAQGAVSNAGTPYICNAQAAIHNATSATLLPQQKRHQTFPNVIYRYQRTSYVNVLIHYIL